MRANRRTWLLGAASTLGAAAVARSQEISVGAPPRIVPSWFVNSAIGSDGNSGTSPGSAFAGLTKVNTSAASSSIGGVNLAAGSSWRDALGFPTAMPVGASLTTYGSGGAPIISGANIVNAGWTVDGTYATVFNASVANNLTGSPDDRGRVFLADGTLLTRVADKATCSTTAGSYVDFNGLTPSPWTVSVHMPDGSNPNGQSVEVTVRENAVILPDNCVVHGPLQIQRAVSNNGALVVGKNADVSNVLVVDGTKHNVLMASGILTDVIACRADTPTSYEPGSTLFVDFANSNLGLNCTHIRNGATLGLTSGVGPTTVVAMFAHDATPGDYYATHTTQQCWTSRMGSGWQAVAKVCRSQGHFANLDFGSFATYTDDGLFEYMVLTEAASGSGISLNSATGAGAKTIIFRNSVFVGAGSNSALAQLFATLNGYTVWFDHCLFYDPVGRSAIKVVDWTSGLIKLTNSIVCLPAGGGFQFLGLTAIPYQGDNNVFMASTSGADDMHCVLNNVTVSTLTAWKAATGQDTHSIVVQPANIGQLFSGTLANGDFRLGNSGAGALAAALGAGPTAHWDWNARAAVAGPPTAYPNVPKTLSDCQTYNANPAAWPF